MGWIESGVKCEKHPDESQQPGVCSSCLRERLCQVSARSFALNYSCSSSPSSSPRYASSASYFSASASPTRHSHRRWRRHHRNGNSVVMSSISHMLSGADGLKKSRSIATVVRRNRAGEAERREKKSGFWSKLTGKRT